MTIYSTVVIDPPWRYDSPGWLGGAERHYETLPMEALIALPMDTVAEENSHLWMWTTDTHIDEAFALIQAWGFERRGIWPWIKLTSKAVPLDHLESKHLDGTFVTYEGELRRLHYGNGYYGRANPEFLILATRGSNIVNQAGRHIRKVIHAPVMEHSQKPEAAYNIIRNMSPGPYIDLFGRSGREGFDSWGLEAEGSVHHGNLNVWSKWAEMRFQRGPEKTNNAELITKGEGDK
jgi:N6-adenosine-specific RNA methylase IME4